MLYRATPTRRTAHHAADHGQADSAHSQSEHGLEAVHVGHGHGHAADADEGSRFNLLAFLNPTMASSFLIGFGGGGVVSRLSGAGAVPSIACAGVSGSLLYYYAHWLIMRVFAAAQASSHTRLDDLLGRPATVIAPIEGTHAGMVALVVGGSRQTFRALSSEGEVIPVGTSVRVRRVKRDTVLVTRNDASGEASFQPPASL